MVNGVTAGYTKGLVINGVGYKVAKQGNKVVLNVGYSHPIEFAEVEGTNWIALPRPRSPFRVSIR